LEKPSKAFAKGFPKIYDTSYSVAIEKFWSSQRRVTKKFQLPEVVYLHYNDQKVSITIGLVIKSF
jgi:hypothetical protein